MSGHLIPRLALAGLLACSLVASARADDPPAQPPAPTPPQTIKILIYTSIDPARLKPVLADFAKTDFAKLAEVKDGTTTVELETGDPDILLGRLLREGAGTSADLLLLPNVARFDRAAVAGLLRPLALPDLERAVPAAYRDPGAQWFGLASFGRAIAFASERVKQADVATYEDLGKPQFKQRVCLPSVSRPSNRALFAAMVKHLNPAGAEAWAKAVAANQASLPETVAPNRSAPEGDDRALIQAIAGGYCDVAIVSSRAIARLNERGDDQDRAALQRIGLSWPNQADRGTEIDLVATAVTPRGDKREPVMKFLSYLATDTGQRLLAEALWSFPIKPGVPLSNAVTRWGPFKADPTPLSTILPLLTQAGQIAQTAGWP